MRFFLFDLLELVSFDKLYLFDDEFDNDGYVSGSPGTFAFPFSSNKSVGSAGESVGNVSGIGFGDFFLTGIESLGDIFSLVIFVPRVVDSKGVQLIESFWRPQY